MEFFFVSRFWAGNPVSPWMSSFIVISLLRLANPRYFINFLQGVPSVGWLGPFLRLEGMSFPTLCITSLYHIYLTLFYFYFFIAMRQPSLSKFYLDHVQRACSFVNRTFHSLVTIR